MTDGPPVGRLISPYPFVIYSIAVASSLTGTGSISCDRRPQPGGSPATSNLPVPSFLPRFQLLHSHSLFIISSAQAIPRFTSLRMDPSFFPVTSKRLSSLSTGLFAWHGLPAGPLKPACSHQLVAGTDTHRGTGAQNAPGTMPDTCARFRNAFASPSWPLRTSERCTIFRFWVSSVVPCAVCACSRLPSVGAAQSRAPFESRVVVA